MHEKIDPAKAHRHPLFKPAFDDVEDYGDMDFAGPGGKTTNVENNEMGILETGMGRTLVRHERAELGSTHDPHRQGIYATNSVGDSD